MTLRSARWALLGCGAGLPGRPPAAPAARRPTRLRRGRPRRPRASARRGDAAAARAPGLRRGQLGEAVRAQHRMPRRGALRRRRREPAARGRAARRSTSRRSRAAWPTRSCRTAPRARSTPRSCRSEHASARPSAILRRRAPAPGATACRSCGRHASRSGARRSASTRPRPGRHSPGTPRRGGAGSRWRTPARDRRCGAVAAQAAADARDHRPLRPRRGPVHRGRGADQAAPAPRGRALATARATRSTPSRAASSTSARATGTRPGRSATRTSMSASRCPREGAPGEIDLWMLGAHALHPGCAYRWMRYASGARVQAQVARFFGATPVNARRLRRCSAGRPAVRCTRTRQRPLLKRIAFRHTPVENCGGGRSCVPFARWEQAWSDAALVLKRGHVATSDRVIPATLRSMSPRRVALLALCTLLAGAGLGYGGVQPRRLRPPGRGGARPATTATVHASGASALRRLQAGRDVRVLSAGLPRDRRRPGPRRRARRSGRALQDRRVRAAHLPSARARDRPPRVRQVQERHGGRAVRARDVLVGLPPRPDGELHLAVRRQAAAQRR